MPIKSEPLVRTTKGLVRGAVDGAIYVFKGIPYAAPPVGDLRWRPPAPVEKWGGERNAQERGPSSFQNAELCKLVGGGDPTPPPLDEDCLYLNVWTPNLDEEAEALPVMVWIHGGGYVIGAGDLPPYVGTPLAARQAVVVNINYRLGHLGFFAHPALDREYDLGRGSVVNNFALLDQIEALKWVQRNIARFGGDPENVTIFGQSAGGRSVLSLFASPLAGNLFHKGVAQSVYGLADVSREDALERGVAVATHFGLPGAEATPADLRNIDKNAFWSIPPWVGKSLIPNPAAFGPPTPISGDAVLPVPLFDVFESGNQLQLPLIIGSNSDDSSVLNDFGFGPDKVIELLHMLGIYDDVKTLYPGVTADDELGRQVGRDLLFTTMSFLIVERHTAKAPSWRYYFDYVAEQSDYLKGTRHSYEIPYVLDTGGIAPPPDENFSDRDKIFANRVSHYWLEFARSASNKSTFISGEVQWNKHLLSTLPGNTETMRFGGFSKILPINPDLEPDYIGLASNFMGLRMTAFRQHLPLRIPEGQVHSYS